MADEKREGGNAERPFVKLVETGQRLAAEAKAREERLARQAELKQRLIAEQAARQGKKVLSLALLQLEAESLILGPALQMQAWALQKPQAAIFLEKKTLSDRTYS